MLGLGAFRGTAFFSCSSNARLCSRRYSLILVPVSMKLARPGTGGSHFRMEQKTDKEGSRGQASNNRLRLLPRSSVGPMEVYYGSVCGKCTSGAGRLGLEAGELKPEEKAGYSKECKALLIIIMPQAHAVPLPLGPAQRGLCWTSRELITAHYML